MKLYDATIKGYKRFKDAEINLQRKLLAIIGPNESGKSSLLEALSRIEDDSEILNRDLTRGETYNNSDVIIHVRYRIHENERALVEKYGGKSEPLQWLNVKKTVSGERVFELYPEVNRDKKLRRDVVDSLIKALNYPNIKKHLENEYEFVEDDVVVNNQSLRQYLINLKGIFNVDKENIDKNDLEYSEKIVQILENGISELKAYPKHSNYLKRITKDVKKLIDFEKDLHPSTKVIRNLKSKRPKFISFKQEHRNLQSEYNIDVINSSMPSSLQNLFDLAEIDREELKICLTNQDHGAIETINEKANNLLKKIYEKNWKQYSVYPRLKITQDFIRIFVKSEGGNTEIAERSDGLKSFISLCSYIHTQQVNVPPILLIDEAEMHLHYDAQADLVRMFELQEQASNVFYSTHSAGCLPNDLGTGIRVVKRTNPEENTSYNSIISQCFWEKAPGFSSILFAMGANIMSFVPTRRALIGEGPVEMILLPTLFREVSGKDYLGFQVAPGLSQVRLTDVAELELEAPKVSYIVDGDKAGNDLKKVLSENGIDEKLIINLEKDHELEDYVNIEEYCKAVNEELNIHHDGKYNIDAQNLKHPKVTKSVTCWCEKNDIKPPSKVKVAENLVRSENEIVRKEKKENLKKIYKQITKKLEL